MQTSAEDFEAYLQNFKRDLNCLYDQDRNVRRRALTKLAKEPFDTKNNETLDKFYRAHLVKPLIVSLEDQTEKNRELSVEILRKCIERVGLKSDEAPILIPAVCSRLNNIPYPETSEEVRMVLIDLLQIALQSNKVEVSAFTSEICSVIGKVLQDVNPEMKNKCSEFLIELCTQLNDKVGHHLKGPIISLAKNLLHQHSKVRRKSIQALCAAIKAPNATNLLEEALIQIKAISNDRSQDVRKELYETVNIWLSSFDIKYLRKFDKVLVLFLLNGVTDEIKEIREKCEQALEQYGKNFHGLLVSIGEEKEESKLE